MKRNRLGFAFGGGAGKGVVHLGVIKSLEEEGIKPDVVTGTSIGALIGSIYSYGYDFSEIERRAREIIKTDEFKQLGFEFFANHRKEHFLERLNSYLKERLTYAKMAVTPFITKKETLKKVVDKLVPDVNIEDLPIPFASVTLDIVSGKDVFITRGPLRDAVLKSISIAGIFPVWKGDGKIIVDGGPTSNVPVEACLSLGADSVIAVSLSNRLSPNFNTKSALSINFRIDEIAKYRLNRIQIEKADVLIEPAVESIHWADFTKIDYGIKAGYETTREKLPEIKKLIKRPLSSRLKRIFLKKPF
ncbi:MAG: patatin-like phospholipase family protein [candidate division WOR-3 bacterium]|nr:patatin-like phospholipase family protein [candidate division WOR-3 bacterium]